MKTFRFVQDDDCHWYLIPSKEYSKFVVMSEDSSSGVCTDVEFINAWDEYRCEHPSRYIVEVK